MSSKEHDQADERYLTDKQLGERFNVHHVTIRKWVNKQGFPEPIRVTPYSVRWRLSEVIAWEQTRATGVSPATTERLRRRA